MGNETSIGRPSSLNTPKARPTNWTEKCGEDAVQLPGRNAGHFEIQVARLSFEDQIAHAAADQPEPAAGPADQLLDLAQWLRQPGNFYAKANGHVPLPS